MAFIGSTEDSCTFSKPELARVIHIHLELNVDFNRKILKGKAVLTIERNPLINEIILDIYGLVISRVTNIDGTCLNYHIGIHHAFGSPLYVQLAKAIDITNNYQCKIEIQYETSPNSPALYWLTPAQTADGLHPFLLSNNKLIYARAVFPCQDTPSVKFTYTAQISVTRNFTVVMSAHLEKIYNYPELSTYEFHQPKLIPSYVVIIAVGSLEQRHLNKNSNIFVEKRFIDKYSKMVLSGAILNMWRIGKMLCGSHVWDRYDICVLPPSISHFDIECPCVTFISPTLLGGDRSAISSLARNISQSWAGNLVTCLNYEHLWLHKSFSIFISRKIISEMFINKDMKFFLQRIGLNNLNNMIEKFGNAGLLKCLLPNLMDLVPHEVIKYVPYETGCMLLDHLENILGGSSVFEPFLKSYFDEFAYKSINTKDWINYLYQYFPDKKQVLDNVTWNTWFINIASPIVMPAITVLETKCSKLAEEWIKWDNKSRSIPSDLIDGNYLCDLQKILFLNFLHSSDTGLTEKKLNSILHRYNCHIQNYNVWFIWLLLCIKVRWIEKVEPALDFAIEFCLPIYAYSIFEHLYEWPEMRPLAIKMYINNKEKMLYETQQKLDIILHLNL